MPDTTLHLGDCLDVMKRLPGASIDLILTSPPYDALRKYASGCAFDFEGVAGECRRLLRPGGVLVWVVGDQTSDGSESGTSFRQALHFKAIGLKLHDTMLYHKACYRPANHRRYEQAFEYMFVFSKGVPRTVNLLTVPCKTAGKIIGGSYRHKDTDLMVPFQGSGNPTKATRPRSNVWTYAPATDPRYSGHPAVMPPQLAIDHILSWTNPGDVVLDPFVGSGTTLAACLRTGREGIGIEKAAEYEPLIRRRLADARAVAGLPEPPTYLAATREATHAA